MLNYLGLLYSIHNSFNHLLTQMDYKHELISIVFQSFNQFSTHSITPLNPPLTQFAATCLIHHTINQILDSQLTQSPTIYSIHVFNSIFHITNSFIHTLNSLVFWASNSPLNWMHNESPIQLTVIKSSTQFTIQLITQLTLKKEVWKEI